MEAWATAQASPFCEILMSSLPLGMGSCQTGCATMSARRPWKTHDTLFLFCERRFMCPIEPAAITARPAKSPSPANTEFPTTIGTLSIPVCCPRAKSTAPVGCAPPRPRRMGRPFLNSGNIGPYPDSTRTANRLAGNNFPRRRQTVRVANATLFFCSKYKTQSSHIIPPNQERRYFLCIGSDFWC